MELETIRLDQYLKLVGAVNSGGEAKHRIQNGEVLVNGQVETRRGRKLVSGDRVGFADQLFTVEAESGE
jgi:ribosome-associated protein